MISFELDTATSIEVILDGNGVDDLIEYLQYVKQKKESFHLLNGKELTRFAIVSNNTLINHVKLIFLQ